MTAPTSNCLLPKHLLFSTSLVPQPHWASWAPWIFGLLFLEVPPHLPPGRAYSPQSLLPIALRSHPKCHITRKSFNVCFIKNSKPIPRNPDSSFLLYFSSQPQLYSDILYFYQYILPCLLEQKFHEGKDIVVLGHTQSPEQCLARM